MTLAVLSGYNDQIEKHSIDTVFLTPLSLFKLS